jgi:TPR repeat protein
MALTASASLGALRRGALWLVTGAFSLSLAAGIRDVVRDVLHPRPCGTLRDRLYLGGHIATGTNEARDTLGLWVNDLACRAGDARGCTNVGRIYDEGWGVTKDTARGVQLYQRGCTAGDGLGCANLGRSYEMGDGVPHDDHVAAVLYEQACALRAEWGCYHLAVCYDRGVGVSLDAARAMELFRTACDGDHARSCTELGTRYETGTGVPADGATAAGFYRRGCAAGDPRACAAARRLEAGSRWGQSPQTPAR